MELCERTKKEKNKNPEDLIISPLKFFSCLCLCLCFARPLKSLSRFDSCRQLLMNLGLSGDGKNLPAQEITVNMFSSVGAHSLFLLLLLSSEGKKFIFSFSPLFFFSLSLCVCVWRAQKIFLFLFVSIQSFVTVFPKMEDQSRTFFLSLLSQVTHAHYRRRLHPRWITLQCFHRIENGAATTLHPHRRPFSLINNFGLPCILYMYLLAYVYIYIYI